MSLLRSRTPYPDCPCQQFLGLVGVTMLEQAGPNGVVQQFRHMDVLGGHGPRGRVHCAAHLVGQGDCPCLEVGGPAGDELRADVVPEVAVGGQPRIKVQRCRHEIVQYAESGPPDAPSGIGG